MMKKDWKPTEAERMLIEQSIAHDRKAQHEIYKKYAKAMYNICLRILNDSAEAEDALQEAFLKAFRNLEGFSGESTLGAWLKRIVVNQCLNQLKKRKLDAISMDDVGFEEPETDAIIDDRGLNLTVEKVRWAIQELPDGFRTIFSLYLLEGYDHQEIAQIMGISASTSKSQYSRAKAKLREILKRKS